MPKWRWKFFFLLLYGMLKNWIDLEWTMESLESNIIFICLKNAWTIIYCIWIRVVIKICKLFSYILLKNKYVDYIVYIRFGLQARNLKFVLWITDHLKRKFFCRLFETVIKTKKKPDSFAGYEGNIEYLQSVTTLFF